MAAETPASPFDKYGTVEPSTPSSDGGSPFDKYGTSSSSPTPEPVAPSDHWNSTRGLIESAKQVPQLAKGVLAGAGAVGEYLFGEGGLSTQLKDYGVKGYQDLSADIAKDSKLTDSWNYSYGQAKEGNYGALVDWAGHMLGYTVGQGLQMVATAGVGGLAGKIALRGATEKLVGGLVAKEAAAIAGTEAGATVSAAVTQQAVKNVAGRIGQNVALGAAATGMEGGEIFGDLTSQAQKEGRDLTGSELMKAGVMTGGAGLLELVGDKIALKAIFGTLPLGKTIAGAQGVGGRIARGVVSAAEAAPVEGATEYGQTILEDWGKGTAPIGTVTPEMHAGAVDAAALGAGGGTVMGGAGGAFTAPIKPMAPPPPPDEKDPLTQADYVRQGTTVEDIAARAANVAGTTKTPLDNTASDVVASKFPGETQAPTLPLPETITTPEGVQRDADQKILEAMFSGVREIPPRDPGGAPTPGFTTDNAGNAFFRGAPLQAMADSELPPTVDPTVGGISQNNVGPLRSLLRLFGKTLIIARAHDGLPDGVVHQGVSRTAVMVTQKTNAADVVSTMVHELFHHFEKSPLYHAFLDTVWENRTERGVAEAYKRHTFATNEDDIKREMASDLAGVELLKPEVVTKIVARLNERLGLEQTKAEVVGFLDHIRNTIARVKDLVAHAPWRNTSGEILTNLYVTKLEKVHDTMAAAAADALYNVHVGTLREKAEKGKLALSSNKEARTVVHPLVGAAFTKIAETQRGAPELAMLRVQRHNIGGVLNPVVEHAGDLLHRMTESAKHGFANQPTMKEKVDRLLRSLEHPYGFEKEAEENLRNNARAFNGTYAGFRDRLNASLKDYHATHAALPVYNRAQWLAREVALAVGHKDFPTAIAHLKALKEIVDSPTYTEHALEHKMTPEGPAPYLHATRVSMDDVPEGPDRSHTYTLLEHIPGHAIGETITKAALLKLRRRPHLAGIQASEAKPTSEKGPYEGAPPSVKGPKSYSALKEILVNLAKEGEPGRMWYERSGKRILEIAEGNVALAEKIIGLFAIYSPLTSVAGNTSVALKAYYQWANGDKITATTLQGDVSAEKAQSWMAGTMGEREQKGIKVSNFYVNLMRVVDPESLGAESRQGVTVDMWIARALGYYSKAIGGPARYAFASKIVSAVAKDLGWEPQQAQAAIWVAIKSRFEVVRDEVMALAKKKDWIEEKIYTGANGKPTATLKPKKEFAEDFEKLFLQRALGLTKAPDQSESKYDYADAVQERTAQISWEAMPGASTGVLPGIHTAPMGQQAEYLEAVDKALRDANGEDQIAILTKIAGAHTIFGPGAWKGNIVVGAQTRTGVATNRDDKSKISVTPQANKLINLYADIRGYVMAQEGVYWSFPVYGEALTTSNGVDIEFGRPLSSEEMGMLYTQISIWAGHDNWAPAFTDTGVRILNFEDNNHKGFQKTIETVVDSFPLTVLSIRAFRAEGSAQTNDWKDAPHGEQYKDRIVSAGSQDLLGRVEVLRQAVVRVNEDFSTRYGWGKPSFSESVPERARIRGSEGVLSEPRRPYSESGKAGTDLTGLPSLVSVDGVDVEFHAFKPAQDAAKAYMKSAGITYTPETVYHKLDKEQSTRIATAYEAMKHEPNDPEVKAAYAAMIKETRAQYDAIMKTGLVVEFFPNNEDTYGNPRNAILDVVENNHFYSFSTKAGFGSNAKFDPSANPLLQETDVVISGEKVLVNDLFRVVHDYFGHIKDGVGFRAEGEDNAWYSHQAMYSALARRAMTTETRGQNSWVNYGPHGEANRKASPKDTIYADQKTGLLPDWAVKRVPKEGTVGPRFSASRKPKNLLTFLKDSIVRVVVYHGTTRDFEQFHIPSNGQNNSLFGDWATKRYAAFFAADPLLAKAFADQGTGDSEAAIGQRIIPAYISLTNPLDFTKGITNEQQEKLVSAGMNERLAYQIATAKADEAWEFFDEDRDGEETVRIMRAAGFDGAVLEESFPGIKNTKSYAIFTPEQAKSATGNSGDYGKTEPRMLFSASKPPVGVSLEDLPKGAKVPNVDWNKEQAQNWITTDPETWKNSGWGRGTPTIYKSYLNKDEMPQVRVSLDLGNEYDWKEFKKTGVYPPLVVVIHANGIATKLEDGHHRMTYWRLKKFDHFPAWVVDFRKNVQKARFSQASGPSPIDLTPAQVEMLTKNLEKEGDSTESGHHVYNATYLTPNGHVAYGSYHDSDLRSILDKATIDNLPEGDDFSMDGIATDYLKKSGTIRLNSDSSEEDDLNVDIRAGSMTEPQQLSLLRLLKNKLTVFIDDEVRNIHREMTPQEFRAFVRGYNDPTAKAQFSAAPTFYSQTEKVLEQKMPNKALAAQITGILSPNNGVKPDELKWLGMDDFLKTKSTFTKAEVMDFVKSNEVQVEETMRGTNRHLLQQEADRLQTAYQAARRTGTTQHEQDALHAWEEAKNALLNSQSAAKYENYQTPGGENYRELLLTLPENDFRLDDFIQKMNDKYGTTQDGNVYTPAWTSADLTEKEAATLSTLQTKKFHGTGSFTSGHFDEPNILVHIRFNDRQVDGKNTLFLEEVQSDWHQTGRDEGYSDEKFYFVHNAGGEYEGRFNTRKEAESHISIHSDGENGWTVDEGPKPDAVPDAPFKKTWHELAMKRMLRYAAENGYDQLAWTTGQMQIDRYDLRKQVDALVVYRDPNGKTYWIRGIKDGDEVMSKRDMTKDKLLSTIGKEIGERALSKLDEPGAGSKAELSGLDLAVGGKGMLKFYDEHLVNFINHYAKKWGARVEKTTIPYAKDDDQGYAEPGDVHSVTLTDAMKTSVVQQGQARFSARNPISPFPMSEPGFIDKWVRRLADKDIDIKRVVEDIRAAGRVVADAINPIFAGEMYQKREQQRAEDFSKDELEPLLSRVVKAGFTLAQFDKFLHARHVIVDKVNSVLEALNPHDPNNKALSGMSDTEANLIYKGARHAELEALAKEVDQIVETSRDLLVDYGLESVSTVNQWKKTYKAYVPLRREGYEDVNAYPTGTGKSVRGSTVQTRGGSTLAVESILANIAQARDQIISRGEKQRPVIAFAAMLIQNANEAIGVIDKHVQITIPDPVTGLPMVVADNRANAHPQMIRRYDPVSKTMKMYPDPNYKGDPNVVNFRIKGQDYSIVFNEHVERSMEIANAFKNMGTDKLSGVMAAIAPYTRYLAAINTQYNPIFGVVNFVRDAQYAMLTLASTPLQGKQLEVLNNARKALGSIYQEARDVRAGRQNTSPMGSMWRRFEHVGGPTGYRDIFMTTEERVDEIKRLMDPSSWSGIRGPQQLGARLEETTMFQLLSDYNLAMENSIRLGVFKAGVDAGMSDIAAASLAKNITVNFNKKGQIGSQMGSLYAFFNANVQGTARIAEVLFDRTKDGFTISSLGKKVITGGLLVGVLQSFMLSMGGFDDDDPPEFVKQKNLVIPVPGTDKGYVMIPMPLGFNLLPTIGRLAAESVANYAMGRPIHGFQKTAELLGAVFGSLSPTGGAGGLQEFAPTVLDPAVSLYTNRDWSGRKIYNEDRSSLDPTPGLSRTRDSATVWAKFTAKAINWATGGTDFTPGVYSPTPDAIDYLIGQTTGGIGREVSKTAQVIQKLAGDEDVPVYKLPLGGRFAGSASGESAIRNRFYENVTRANVAFNELEGRAKSHQEFSGYLLGNPAARFSKEGAKIMSTLNELRKQKERLHDQGASQDQIKLINERSSALMQRFNEAMAKAEGQ